MCCCREEYFGLRVRKLHDSAQAINIPVNTTVGPSGVPLQTLSLLLQSVGSICLLLQSRSLLSPLMRLASSLLPFVTALHASSEPMRYPEATKGEGGASNHTHDGCCQGSFAYAMPEPAPWNSPLFCQTANAAIMHSLSALSASSTGTTQQGKI